MSRGHELLYLATQGFRDDADLKVVTPPTPGCASCQRPWDAVEQPNQGVIYQYATTLAKEYVCTTCYTPRIGSGAMLGVERSAGRSGKPVYAKLGMMPGCGGVITPDAELHLSQPPKNLEKYGDGWLGRHHRLHGGSSLALLLNLYAEGKLDDAHSGFVFIESWGTKADVLMASWRGSTSFQEVWCLTEKGASPLDLAALIKTARVLHDQGLVEPAQGKGPGYWRTFWRPILSDASGQRDQDKLEAWAGNLPDPVRVLEALPVDPHSRLRLPDVMRVLTPLLLEGTL